MTAEARENWPLFLVQASQPIAAEPDRRGEPGDPGADPAGDPPAVGAAGRAQPQDTSQDVALASGRRQLEFWKRSGGEGGSPPKRRWFWQRITRRVIEGGVMIVLGGSLGVSNFSNGNGDMLYLLPILIGSLTLVSQGWLFVVTANEPRRHDPNARRVGGQVQIVLGFAMTLAMLRYSGDDGLKALGYFSGFVVFASGWVMLIRTPVARTD